MRASVVSLCLLLGLFVLPAPNASAQIVPRGSLNFILGVPQGDFADNVDNLGFGIELQGGIGIQPAFMIGADLGFLIYGTERRSEPFSTTIPDVTVDVRTTNNILMGDLFFRIQPQASAIQPYVEGVIGFKYLFTETSVQNENFGEEVASSTNFDDFASSFGGGAGVDIHLHSGESEEGKPFSIMLHLGARYLFGSSADYLKKGSVRREDGQVTFDVSRSRTDLLIPKLGVTFKF